MAKTIENQAEDPNEEVVTLVHDIASGTQREVRVKRVDVWRSLLGLGVSANDADVITTWRARQDENAAEANRQSQRSDDLRAAAERLRNFDAAALTALIGSMPAGPARTALTSIAALLADLRIVIKADRQ